MMPSLPLRTGNARVSCIGLVTGALLALGTAAAQARPAPTADVVPGEEHCVVNVRANDPLNLRTGPGVKYRVLTRLRYGQCGVMVRDECRDNWCPVEEGHYAGWVHAHYIAMVSPARYCIVGIDPRERLPLRAFPSFQSRVMAQIGAHTCSIAFLPYAREGWQKIRAEGYEGWVPRAHLSGQ
jgi:SH3-like domain-containing protein